MIYMRNVYYTYILYGTLFLISNSLWLANLRRPVRDTLINISLKMWGVEILRSGDFPFWVNNARYGFSIFILQYFHVFTFTFLIAPFGTTYNLHTFIIESFIWQLVGVIGMYCLARQFLRITASAAACAISFVASGSVWLGGTLGALEAGYSGVPWVLLGVTWATRSTTLYGHARSLATITLGYVWMVSSGYPQTWLSLPVFAIPFTLILAGSSLRPALAALATCASAVSLSLLILSPVIVETLATPPFAGEVRPAYNSDEGALPLAGYFGRLVANPTYTPGATVIHPNSGLPLYIGLLGATVLPWRVASSLYQVAPRLRATVTIAAVASLSFASLPATTGHPSIGTTQANLAAAGVILLILAVSPLPPLSWRRDELALLSLVAVAWVCATDNFLGSLIRQSIPPISWSRWSFGYLGISVVPELLLVWMTLERLTLTAANTRTDRRWHGHLPTALCLVVVATLATCLVWFPGAHPSATSLSGESRTGLLSLIWSIAVLVVLTGFALIFRFAQRVARPFLLASGATLLVGTLLASTVLAPNEALVHAYVSLPGPGTLTADAIHSIIVAAAIALVSRCHPPRKVITAIAAIAMLDVIAAKPRYLADTDMVLGGQPLHDVGAPPHLDFVGTSRNEHATASFFGGRPSSVAWTGVVPQTAALEQEFGNPPLFDQFVHFPAAWTVTGPASASFTPESLRGSPHQTDATPSSLVTTPDCPLYTAPDAPEPSAKVTKFLSAYVQLSYDSACTRLLVYTDTWAQGWSATIDGYPVEVIKLNGAIRGVSVPAGSHTLEWTYRPAYWAITKWISISGLLVTGACLAWGLWPDRCLGRQPAR